jgi:hypothetical protein
VWPRKRGKKLGAKSKTVTLVFDGNTYRLQEGDLFHINETVTIEGQLFGKMKFNVQPIEVFSID